MMVLIVGGSIHRINLSSVNCCIDHTKVSYTFNSLLSFFGLCGKQRIVGTRMSTTSETADHDNPFARYGWYDTGQIHPEARVPKSY